MSRICVKCKKPTWCEDNHDTCARCTGCHSSAPCDLCQSWPLEAWKDLLSLRPLKDTRNTPSEVLSLISASSRLSGYRKRADKSLTATHHRTSSAVPPRRTTVPAATITRPPSRERRYDSLSSRDRRSRSPRSTERRHSPRSRRSSRSPSASQRPRVSSCHSRETGRSQEQSRHRGEQGPSRDSRRRSRADSRLSRDDRRHSHAQNQRAEETHVDYYRLSREASRRPRSERQRSRSPYTRRSWYNERTSFDFRRSHSRSFSPIRNFRRGDSPSRRSTLSDWRERSPTSNINTWTSEPEPTKTTDGLMQGCKAEILRILSEEAFAPQVAKKNSAIKPSLLTEQEEKSSSFPLSNQAALILEKINNHLSGPAHKPEAVLPAFVTEVEYKKTWYETPDAPFSGTNPETERELEFFGVQRQPKDQVLPKRTWEHFTRILRQLVQAASFNELASNALGTLLRNSSLTDTVAVNRLTFGLNNSSLNLLAGLLQLIGDMQLIERDTLMERLKATRATKFALRAGPIGNSLLFGGQVAKMKEALSKEATTAKQSTQRQPFRKDRRATGNRDFYTRRRGRQGFQRSQRGGQRQPPQRGGRTRGGSSSKFGARRP